MNLPQQFRMTVCDHTDPMAFFLHSEGEACTVSHLPPSLLPEMAHPMGPGVTGVQAQSSLEGVFW